MCVLPCWSFSVLCVYFCCLYLLFFFFFFFQAEDGIRDLTVTGVQTCALPICVHRPQAGTVPGSIRRENRARRVNPGASRQPPGRCEQMHQGTRPLPAAHRDRKSVV